ncbi:MAG: cyclic nucleotide-binding domain-containing protein [Dehalococcoidia bacterium]|nr:cyclic nucleotide-binding domain-containing protein [Dehalococcoidia bacterium]
MRSKPALRECPVFEALDDAELDRLEALSGSKEYEAGTTVFTEGSVAEALYVLERGKLAIQMQMPMSQPQLSKRVTVDIVTANEVFGWSAVVEPYRYTLTAVCLEHSKVLAIDAVKLRTLLQDDTRIGYEVLSRLTGVVASRLDETRHVLISERLLSTQA